MKYPVHVMYNDHPYTSAKYASQYTFMTIEEMNTKFVLLDNAPIEQRVVAIRAESIKSWLEHEQRLLEIYVGDSEWCKEQANEIQQRIETLKQMQEFFKHLGK